MEGLMDTHRPQWTIAVAVACRVWLGGAVPCVSDEQFV